MTRNTLIDQIKRELKDLKKAEIEGIIYILLNQEGISSRDLIRKTGLPKEILRKFKSVIGGILDDTSGDILNIKETEIQKIRDIKPAPYQWSLLEYSNPDIEEKLKEIRKKYDLEPKREYDQFFADVKTSVSKIEAMKAKGAISGKRILLLGDDDLLSITLGLMEQEYIDITVVDVDEDILETIKKITQEYNLKNIKTIKYDAREQIPNDLFGAFDVVVIDPPYTKSGVQLFLNRSVQFLRLKKDIEGGYIFLYFGNSYRSPEKFIKIQEIINNFNLVIEDRIDKFSRYHGAESIGSASSLYVLKTTKFTDPLQEELLTDVIYTFENQEEEKFPYVDQVTIKLFDVPDSVVKSRNSLMKALGEFCKKHKLKVVDKKITGFSKGGLSITFILASSNLLVHTWPELNAVHLDIVTCSPIYEKTKIPHSLKELFDTSKIEFNVIE
jgi:predicted methyltransferase